MEPRALATCGFEERDDCERICMPSSSQWGLFAKERCNVVSARGRRLIIGCAHAWVDGRATEDGTVP